MAVSTNHIVNSQNNGQLYHGRIMVTRWEWRKSGEAWLVRILDCSLWRLRGKNTKKSCHNRTSEYKRLRSGKSHIAFGTTGGTKNRPIAQKTEEPEVKSIASGVLWSLRLYPMGNVEPLKSFKKKGVIWSYLYFKRSPCNSGKDNLEKGRLRIGRWVKKHLEWSRWEQMRARSWVIVE